MASVLSKPYFHDEAAAYAKLESIVWPNGPVCVHCGGTKRIGKLRGNATRVGVHKCYSCRKQFRVTVDTVFESSHVKLHEWLQAAYLIASSKKGISSNQMARALGCTLKTGWFVTHRLREAMAMREAGPQMGGQGGIVEIDETFYGRNVDELNTFDEVLLALDGKITKADGTILENLQVFDGWTAAAIVRSGHTAGYTRR